MCTILDVQSPMRSIRRTINVRRFSARCQNVILWIHFFCEHSSYLELFTSALPECIRYPSTLFSGSYREKEILATCEQCKVRVHERNEGAESRLLFVSVQFFEPVDWISGSERQPKRQVNGLKNPQTYYARTSDYEGESGKEMI